MLRTDFYHSAMFGVKYFDIITFAIIPAPVGAELRPGQRHRDRINKEGREKKPHGEVVLRAPIVYYPQFSGAEISASL